MNAATDLVVHIIDDIEANRELLQDLLDSVDIPWQSHSNALDFLDVFDVETTSCLLLDVRMPKMSGLQLIEKLNEDGVSVPIILVTAHGDVPMAIQAMKQGAFDFYEKPINTQAVLDSVYRAIDHRQSDLETAEETASAREAFESLTPRERDVYALVVDGAMNKQIAYDLSISQRTVEVHRAKLMEKMGVRNLAELIKTHIRLQSA